MTVGQFVELYARRLPRDHRAAFLHDVHTLLFEERAVERRRLVTDAEALADARVLTSWELLSERARFYPIPNGGA
jgi:hypothetical protein